MGRVIPTGTERSITCCPYARKCHSKPTASDIVIENQISDWLIAQTLCQIRRNNPLLLRKPVAIKNVSVISSLFHPILQFFSRHRSR